MLTNTVTGTPVRDIVSNAVPVTGRIHGAVNRALSAIESVHGLPGDMRRIQVMEVPLLGDNGQYVYGDDGYSQVIRVRPTSPHPELTVAHEVGHYFDHQAYRTRFSMTKYFASAEHEDFEHFRRTIDASRPAQVLRKILEGDTYKIVNPQGETLLLPVRPVHREYHQGYNELWARAYAQYIALRSGNTRMRGQIDALLSSGSEINRTLQWDWEEFIPIAEAIEEVLEAKACLSRS